MFQGAEAILQPSVSWNKTEMTDQNRSLCLKIRHQGVIQSERITRNQPIWELLLSLNKQVNCTLDVKYEAFKCSMFIFLHDSTLYIISIYMFRHPRSSFSRYFLHICCYFETEIYLDVYLCSVISLAHLLFFMSGKDSFIQISSVISLMRFIKGVRFEYY